MSLPRSLFAEFLRKTFFLQKKVRVLYSSTERNNTDRAVHVRLSRYLVQYVIMKYIIINTSNQKLLNAYCTVLVRSFMIAIHSIRVQILVNSTGTYCRCHYINFRFDVMLVFGLAKIM